MLRWIGACLLAASGCAEPQPERREPADAAAPSAPSFAPTVSASAASSAPVASACPADMVLAAGRFCPAVEQRCLQHTKEYEEAEERRERAKAQGLTPPRSNIAERCLRFAKESRCLSSERRPMRFCLDRHEWPNRAGEKPALLVTWTQAKASCEAVAKRLCSEDELTFACEGEEMWPYSYGFERDAERCQIDRPYVQPRFKLQPYDACMASPRCKEHLAELDQRVPIGTMTRCTSPFGAFDLNGNVNEWVERPGQQAPWRSGLKGGWWGPSRSRCRPMVIAHNENYAGYEVGFRCCRDAI